MTEEYDIVIQNGRIVDGIGRPPFKGDVGVRGQTIAKVDEKISADAVTTINASRKVVSPGFIDMHSHNDMALLFDSRLESMIRQGVTTSVVVHSRVEASHFL